MLSIKDIVENKEIVIERLNTRNKDFKPEIENLIKAYQSLTKTEQKLNELQEKRNVISKQIGESIKTKTSEQIDAMKQEVTLAKVNIEKLEKAKIRFELKVKKIIDLIPNIPSKTTLVGKSEDENKVLKKFGTETTFNFKPKPYYDLTIERGLIDYERGVKTSGTRYAIYRDKGARLLNALIMFMLDKQRSNGYEPIVPPVVVSATTMYSSGHLPKFKDDLFELNTKQFLIPTAEVVLLNMYRDEIIDEDKLPIALTAYTSSFRSEAGSAGRDTKGIIRMHQFNKVELVKITTPETDMAEFENMVSDAKSILDDLELPYQILELCTGDIGFASQKTYDLEVYFPHEGKYREISSISTCSDFQARRANIKFRKNATEKTRLTHTLNASGLAVDRCFAAIIENYQNEDGSITVPKALVKYIGLEKL